MTDPTYNRQKMRLARARQKLSLTKRKCSLCDRGHYAGGYCEPHYDKRRRLRKAGRG